MPLLLPAREMPAHDRVLRREYGDGTPAQRQDYDQLWFAADGSRRVNVTTHLDQAPYALDGEPVDVGLWDDAVLPATGLGYVNLTLAEPTGYVSIVTHGFERDTVVDLARSMTRRADGEPGWTIDAPALLPIEEDWSIGAASRTVQWSEGGRLTGELSITNGQPAVFSYGPSAGSTVTLEDVGGATAVVVQREVVSVPALTLMVWSPQPDVQVYLGVTGPVGEALEIARSVRAVDLETWGAASDVDTDPGDGCRSFLC